MKKIKRFFVVVWAYVLLGLYFSTCFVCGVSSWVAGLFKSKFKKKSKPCCEPKADNENKHKYKNLTIVFGNTVLCKKYDCCEKYEGYTALKILAIGPRVKCVSVGQIVLVDSFRFNKLIGDILEINSAAIRYILDE